jgi:hypothetical protein
MNSQLSGLTLDDIRQRVRAAANWLCRSQDAVKGKGSSAYYAPCWGWASAYPETTGYIIPTLWTCADRLGSPEYGYRAEQMARWLLDTQDDQGWFPSGVWKVGGPKIPSVFNTGQVLFGLLEAVRRTSDNVFQQAADRAALWLVRNQDTDGRWTVGAFRAGYYPSYYTHMLWPLALYWKQNESKETRDCIRRGMSSILENRNESGTFRNWGFYPNRPAFTHTIAYTLHGLLETALLLDEWAPYGLAAQASLDVLVSHCDVQRRLAGAYGLNWEPSTWYICLTGHCQLASAWLRLYGITRDSRFLIASAKALREVCAQQQVRPSRPNVHGAIAGSSPFFGRYMALRYPNWAAKFFVDAMFSLQEHLPTLPK